MVPERQVERFEAFEIDVRDFRHREHVRMAWNYLHLYPLAEATERYAAALLGFATHHGHPERYHETVTRAYMHIVDLRRRDSPGASWEDFAAENVDLFVWPDGALAHYYTKETLSSERARAEFVPPDLREGF